MGEIKTTHTSGGTEEGFFARLCWKFYMWKLNFYCGGLERKNKRDRKKYCRRGYHKLTSSSVGYGGTNQRMKTIRFLKCAHCKYLFFSKKSDKERYLKYKKRHDSRLKDSFSAMLKHSSGAKPKH